MSELLRFFKDMRDNGYGLAEIAAQLGTSAIAEPVAGFAAMYDPAHGADAIREGMTYTPRTQEAQQYSQSVGNAASAAIKPAMPIIDTWKKGVDIAGQYSPVVGAGLRTVPAAIGIAMGAKPALQAGRQVSKGLEKVQSRMVANATAPRTLNTGYMGQRGAIGTLSTDDDLRALARFNQMDDVYKFDNSHEYYDPIDKLVARNLSDESFDFMELPTSYGKISITPSAKEQGKWQVTQWAKDGNPLSDSGNLTKEKALRVFFEDSRPELLSPPKRPLTEFEQAHLTAQRNAALPVEKGGLGLPPNNTAMDRARAMGFDVDNPVYHGTGADIKEFRNDLLGGNTGAPSAKLGHFFAETPHTASQYARTASKLNVDDNVIFNEFMKNQIERFNNIKGLPEDFKINSIDDLVNRKELLQQKREIIKKSKKGTWLSKDDNEKLSRIDSIEGQWDNTHTNALSLNNSYLIEKYGDDYRALTPRGGANTIPVLLKKDKNYLKDFDGRMYRDEKFSDLMKKAKDSQYDSVTFANTFDPADIDLAKNPENIYAVFDPKNIRSRFAAFDPFNRESSNLLATTAPLVPTTALGAYMYNENRKKSQGKQ